MSWYTIGNDVLERAQKFSEERDNAKYPARRFFIKPGASAKVTFLDDGGFGFLEHNVQLDGRWGNFYTCLRDFSECPLCDSGHRPSYVVAWTIIDHSKYVSEVTGKEYKNTKKLLVAKQSVIAKIFRRREAAGGDLKYAVLEFHRDKKKECSTGEDVEFIKTLRLEEVLKFKDPNVSESDWLAPFDYIDMFKPKTVEELRKIVGQPEPIGSDAYTVDAGGDEFVGDDDALNSIL